MTTALQIIQLCCDKVQVLEKIIPVALYQQKIAEIDQQINDPEFWNDQRNAATVMKERQKLSDLSSKILTFKQAADFNMEFATSYPQDVDSLLDAASELLKQLSELEFQQMMSDPIDNSPAILTINSGAGGLESANFVSMLLRMYVRYASANGFKIEILDEKRSEEHSSICIDSVSISISGNYAYGFLKGENGVHRLIRQSPFNSGAARHTSFASVAVQADIEDDIDIVIEDKDIEITSQTAGGPGGQSNRVKSAIRLKHFPTGINILVRTERDQLSNKKTAFKMLKAKLYELELKKKQQEIDKNISTLSDASFGSQIKTYTLTPYSLVKDHRTGYETSQANNVLDGDITQFLISYLHWDK